MTISGVDAWQYEPAGNGYFLETDIYKMPNVVQFIYVSDNHIDDSSLKLYNQILSTFKFTNSVDTSTWKTYRNSQYGFEIKYPSDWSVGNLYENYSGREGASLYTPSADLPSISIVRYKTSEIIPTMPPDSRYRSTIKVGNSYTYDIIYIDRYNQTFSQLENIISTFKFVN